MSSPSLPPSSTVDTGLLYQLLGETRATFNRSTVQPGPALKAQPPSRAYPPSGVGAGAGAAAVFNRPAPVARPPLVSLPTSLLNLERHADAVPPVVFAVSRSINAAAGAVQKSVQRSSAPVRFPPSNQKQIEFPFARAGSDPSFHCICSSLRPSRLPSDLPLEYGQAGSGLDDRRDPRSRCLGGAGSLCAIVPNAQTGGRESRVGGSLLGGVLAVAPGKGSNSPRRALLHCRGTRGKLGGGGCVNAGRVIRSSRKLKKT